MANRIAKRIVTFLNGLYEEAAGGERRAAFFDTEQVYPALKEVDAHFDEIRAELLELLRAGAAIPAYHVIDRRQSYISNSSAQAKRWRVFLLFAMGEKPENNRSRCPRTVRVLDRVPGLFQAFFSILDAGKSIPAHRGSFMGYIRYHLPLIVPEHQPPKLRVKDQTHTWKLGESILFDDSWEHEVINTSDSPRVVLIVDVLRPLPPTLHVINVLFKQVVRLFHAKRMIKNMEEFEAAARLDAA